MEVPRREPGNQTNHGGSQAPAWEPDMEIAPQLGRLFRAPPEFVDDLTRSQGQPCSSI